MTKKCGYLAILALALQTNLLHASDTSPTKVPGTGVSMTLPSAMKRGPIGTYFIEPTGNTVVQIMVGTKEHAVENGQMFKKIYPLEPRQIDRGGKQARLYKRTREDNGGGWDGWSYNLVGKQSALNVSVMYTGSDDEWFGSFERFLETVDWDERQLDSEKSFQAQIVVPGLKMVQKQVGGLSFTTDGAAGDEGSSFVVQTLPVSPAQASQLFPAICDTAIPQSFGEAKYSGPHRFESEDVVGCDGWGKVANGMKLYVVMLRTADGGVVSAIGNLSPGSAEPNEKSLRAALLQMKRLK